MQLRLYFIYKEQIKAWSPRLRAAVKLAKSAAATSFKYVVSSPQGGKVTEAAFDTAWRKARATAAKKHPELEFDFTFHDVKAKAISDYEGDKQKFSGHKTPQMVATYDRKTEIVDTH